MRINLVHFFGKKDGQQKHIALINRGLYEVMENDSLIPLSRVRVDDINFSLTLLKKEIISKGILDEFNGNNSSFSCNNLKLIRGRKKIFTTQ